MDRLAGDSGWQTFWMSALADPTATQVSTAPYAAVDIQGQRPTRSPFGRAINRWWLPATREQHLERLLENPESPRGEDASAGSGSQPTGVGSASSV